MSQHSSTIIVGVADAWEGYFKNLRIYNLITIYLEYIITLLEKIKSCFNDYRVLYSKHSRIEMEIEPFGEIKEHEVYEAIVNGKIIKYYTDDEPYPSCLIYGKTNEDRPIHIVCAHEELNNWAIVITVYEPDPEKWIDFERRRT